VAFGHGLHGLTENVLVNAKKFTCGRRFWHGLHGLKIKELKISPGWPFTRIENIFVLNTIYVAFGHGLHGLSIKFQRLLKKKNMWSPLLALTSRT
jgi:hypothetical protein